MNILKTLVLVAPLSVVVVACATAVPPQELVDARNAYHDAEVAAAETAPTDLHEAKVELDAAERSFRAEPKGTVVKDRAYIAQRRAELASTNAAIFASTKQRDAANDRLRALGASAADQLVQTKEVLTAEQQKGRVATRDLAAAKTDLNSTKTDLNATKSDLKDTQSKAADLQTQLAQEKEARQQTELKLTATLQAMKDLQSVKEEQRGLVITLSGQVLFASGQSVLLPAAQKALDNVAEALKATPDRTITVEGHTDSQGTPGGNMELSQRRADAVRTYLVTRGIPDASVRATGFGQDRPISDNNSVEGRANNRRVEIVLAPAPEKR